MKKLYTLFLITISCLSFGQGPFTATYDFEASKNGLIVAVQKFKAGPSTIIITQHPFWGKLTEEDWNTLMWKHLDHHLKQFGV